MFEHARTPKASFMPDETLCSFFTGTLSVVRYVSFNPLFII